MYSLTMLIQGIGVGVVIGHHCSKNSFILSQIQKTLTGQLIVLSQWLSDRFFFNRRWTENIITELLPYEKISWTTII